jgi:hypothetical protein
MKWHMTRNLFFDEKINNELSFGIGCLSESLLTEVVSE